MTDPNVCECEAYGICAYCVDMLAERNPGIVIDGRNVRTDQLESVMAQMMLRPRDRYEREAGAL